MSTLSNLKIKKLPRICFLTESIYPPGIGGLEKHAFQLSEKLNSLGTSLFVITRKMEEGAKSFEKVGNVIIRRIPPKGELKGKGWKAVLPIMFLMIMTLFMLIKYIKHYEIILVSGLKILSFPAVIVSKLFNKKCVIKIESPIELREDISEESLRKMKLKHSSFILKLLRGLRYPIIRNTDYLVAISLEIEQQLLNIRVDPKKIQYIPNGLNLEIFSPASLKEKIQLRKKILISEDKNIFVFTGRLAISKGVLRLIEVWNQVVQKYPDCLLLFVGSGKGSFDDCQSELENYIHSNRLENNAILIGEIENVNEYLRAADVFVFPSEYEGFSLALIEALACGLPSVVSKVGAAEELIQNYQSGIVFNHLDKQELSNSIEWLLENKDKWNTMGNNARCIAEKYSIEKVAYKYQHLFSSLMDNDKIIFDFNHKVIV